MPTKIMFEGVQNKNDLQQQISDSQMESTQILNWENCA